MGGPSNFSCFSSQFVLEPTPLTCSSIPTLLPLRVPVHLSRQPPPQTQRTHFCIPTWCLSPSGHRFWVTLGEPSFLSREVWLGGVQTLSFISPPRSKPGFFFKAPPVAYGSSQARGRNRAAVTATATAQPQQHGIRATSGSYTPAHSNSRSLTHRAGPGIQPASSWILVRFITEERQLELPSMSLNFLIVLFG